MIRVLPSVAEENVFALEGGTAINLFIRDLPHLSVSDDLTYGKALPSGRLGRTLLRAQSPPPARFAASLGPRRGRTARGPAYTDAFRIACPA